MKTNFLESEFNLWVSFVNKTDNAIEEFGFHSNQDDDKQTRFLFNHMSELRIFSKWFLSENAKLISFLQDNPINLVSLLGSEFYKNRIREIEPGSDQVRNKFLRSLGIQTEPDLSQIELDSLRLIVRGYTVCQIAKQLFRSKRTIEHRIERIKEKLACSSKTELVQKALELEYFIYS